MDRRVHLNVNIEGAKKREEIKFSSTTDEVVIGLVDSRQDVGFRLGISVDFLELRHGKVGYAPLLWTPLEEYKDEMRLGQTLLNLPCL